MQLQIGKWSLLLLVLLGTCHAVPLVTVDLDGDYPCSPWDSMTFGIFASGPLANDTHVLQITDDCTVAEDSFRADAAPNPTDIYISSSQSDTLTTSTNFTLTCGIGSVEYNFTIIIPDDSSTDPVITTPLSFTVDETADVGTPIGTVECSDADTIDQNYLTWATVSDSGDALSVAQLAYFIIDSQTGILYIKKSLANYAEPVLSHFAISCKDQANNEDDETFVVRVTQSNNNLPACDSYFVTQIIPENVDAGAEIATLTCTDADEADSLVFYLADDTYLGVNEFGSIIAKSLTGFPLPTNHAGTTTMLTTTAYIEDTLGNPPTHRFNALVAVEVEDVNEAPYWPPDTTINVAENTALGTMLGQFTANDDDFSYMNSDIYYTIIPDVSGIRLIGGGDYGRLEKYDSATNVWSTVCDDGTMPDTYATTLCSDLGYYSGSVIPIDGYNQTAHPILYKVDGCPSACDTVAIGATVCTHADDVALLCEGPRDVLPFHIDCRTGELYLTKQLNFEDTMNYTIILNATDGKGLTASRTLGISVTDVNDNPPVFKAADGTVTDVFTVDTLTEQSPAGQEVLTLYVTDADPDTSITLGISSDVGEFELDGDIIVLTSELDAEADDTDIYTVVVTAADTDGVHTATATVLVYLGLINEFGPEFQVESATATVPENTGRGAKVAFANFTDGDFGVQGLFTIDGNIISGDDNGYFELDANRGDVFLKKSLDYESGPQSFELVIEASENEAPNEGPWRTGTGTITITVEDVSDEFVSCSSRSYFSPGVAQDISLSDTITIVTCQDDDDGEDPGFTLVNANSNFDISSTGAVTALVTPLEVTTYHMEVHVTDGGDLPGVIIIPLSIQVDPRNLFSPVCVADSAVQITENTLSGAVVFDFLAADQDNSPYDIDDYIISDTNDAGTADYFLLDAVYGKLYQAKPLDCEVTGTSIWIDVTVTDGGGEACVTRLTITVIDVDDNFPTCDSSTRLAISIREDERLYQEIGGRPLWQFNCEDADISQNLQLALAPNDYFGIDTENGYLILEARLDYETATSHVIAIEAAGTAYTIFHMVVNVEPVNDEAPSFLSHLVDTTVTVPEDAAIGDPVIQMWAEDSDLGEGGITYSIVDGNTDGAFLIHPRTGQIVVGRQLDRETTSLYDLTIKAQDGGAVTHATETSLEITISDVNDNPPICGMELHFFSVSEIYLENAATTPHHLVNLGCTDNDLSPDLTYTMQADMTSHFQVDQTGVVAVRRAMDFDNGNEPRSYRFSVTVSDTVSDPLVIPCVFTLLGSNEHQPQFQNQPYRQNVMENTTVWMSLFQVDTADDDSGDTSDGWVEYAWAGAEPGNFHLDTKTGEILLKSPLDRENIDSYEIRIQALNGELSAQTSVIIDVVDFNDHPPKYGNRLYKFRVEEDAQVGTVVGVINAMDSIDIMTYGNAAISYEMVPSVAAFSVGTTGEITVAALLDFETTPSYRFKVIAQDQYGIGSDRLSATALVKINVLNLNDNSPTFSPSSYSTSISESTLVSTSVLQVTATDADAGYEGHFMYTIQEDVPFVVDPLNGTVSVSGPLDFEEGQTHTFEILAIDKVLPLQTGTAAVTLHITDVNDNAPVCSDVSMHVPENQTVDSHLHTLICTDRDESTNFGFTIQSGDSNGRFMLNSTTGELFLQAALDFEMIKWYNLVIHVTDSGSPALAYTGNVIIIVDPVNEHPPQPTVVMDTVSIAEDAPIGESIYTIQASDADDPAHDHGHLTFIITAGNDGDHFQVEENKMYLTNPLDRETQNMYTISVEILDGGDPPMSATFTLLVDVTDVNDNIPKFVPPVYVASLLESSPSQSLISVLTIFDDDAQLDNNCFYSITSGNAEGIFMIDNCSLELSTNLDYETSLTHTLHVSSADGNGPMANAMVILHVGSVNEFSPTIINSIPALFINEDSHPGTPLATVTATDADRGIAGQVSYYIASPVSGTPFGIETQGEIGRLFLKTALDYEQGDFLSVVVAARDNPGGSPFSTATVPISVRVQDVNDNTPRFSAVSTSIQIDENAIPSPIASFPATDDDTADSLFYTLVHSEDSGNFRMDGNNLIAITTFDYEEKSSYILHVLVSDRINSEPGLSVEIQIDITIRDLNDNVPESREEEAVVSVGENLAVGTFVTSVTFTDSDGSPSNSIVKYHLQESTTDFNINNQTGVVTTANVLDRETTDEHVFQVLAVKSPVNASSLTGTMTLTVMVLDENDNSPIITSTNHSYVSENLPMHRQASHIIGHDPDTGRNQELVYRILTGGDSSFAINQATGVIKTTKVLDHEIKDMYELDIEVCDRGSSARCTYDTIAIYVSDMNDNAPVFENVIGITIPDRTQQYSVVAQVIAEDADSGINSYLEYRLLNNDISIPFGINEISGEIIVESELVGFPDIAYQLEIEARDRGHPSMSSMTTFTITLSRNSFLSSLYPDRAYKITLLENAPIGQKVIEPGIMGLGAVDSILYDYIDVTGASDGYFRVDTTTGAVFLTRSPDYEVTQTLHFQVRATIHINDTIHNSIADITVDIVDRNDNQPQFTQSNYRTYMVQDAGLGSTILKVMATDADSGPNGELLYTLPNSENRFGIKQIGGEGIITKEQVQALLENRTYTIVVTVTDQGTDIQLSDTSELSIITFNRMSLLSLRLALTGDEFSHLRPSLIDQLNRRFLGTTVIHFYQEQTDYGVLGVSNRRRRRQAQNPSTFVLVDLFIVEQETTNYNPILQFVHPDKIKNALQDPEFAIFKVVDSETPTVVQDPATTEEVAWKDTSRGKAGIALFIIIVIILLIIIIILIVLLVIKENKEKRSVTPIIDDEPESIEYTRANKYIREEPTLVKESQMNIKEEEPGQQTDTENDVGENQWPPDIVPVTDPKETETPKPKKKVKKVKRTPTKKELMDKDIPRSESPHSANRRDSTQYQTNSKYPEEKPEVRPTSGASKIRHKSQPSMEKTRPLSGFSLISHDDSPLPDVD